MAIPVDGVCLCGRQKAKESGGESRSCLSNARRGRSYLRAQEQRLN